MLILKSASQLKRSYSSSQTTNLNATLFEHPHGHRHLQMMESAMRRHDQRQTHCHFPLRKSPVHILKHQHLPCASHGSHGLFPLATRWSTRPTIFRHHQTTTINNEAAAEIPLLALKNALNKHHATHHHNQKSRSNNLSHELH